MGWSSFGYPKGISKDKVANDTTGRRGERKKEKKKEKLKSTMLSSTMLSSTMRTSTMRTSTIRTRQKKLRKTARQSKVGEKKRVQGRGKNNKRAVVGMKKE